MSNTSKLITIKEAATLLCMTESRIRYEIFRKNIPFYKIGRSIRFKESDLHDWVSNKKVQQKEG